MYANCLLGDQQKNFHDFLKAVRECELTRIAMPEQFINVFWDLLQYNDVPEIDLLIKKKKILPLKKLYPSPPRPILDGTSEARMLLFYVAFEAIYGFRDGYCETHCQHREKRKVLIGAERFNGPDRACSFRQTLTGGRTFSGL